MLTVLAQPGTLVAGATVSLDEEERHHLRVRRAAAGEEVLALDGAGAVADAVLDQTPGGVGIRVARVEGIPRPPRFTLVVGAGDKERFGWLAEKAAELGVTELVPLKTERTRSVAAGIREAHVLALQRRARQAIKQSRAPWAPTVHSPIGLREAALLGGDGLRWLADPRAEAPPPIDPVAPLMVVVGPEGGLVEAERAILLEAGFLPVRLAPDLLRFETAALAAAAVVASQRPRRSNA